MVDRDRVIYLPGRIKEVSTTARATPGGSLIYAVNGLNSVADGFRSDTLELTLSEDLPLYMVACLCAEGAGAQDGYKLYWNINGTRQTDYPHTGIGGNEQIRTNQVSMIAAPGIGTHEIYAELVETTVTVTGTFGEWSGFVVVGADGSGDIS